MHATTDRQPDSPYARRRLALALLVATIACVGGWSVVVVLPAAQAEFGVGRAAASLAYTLNMTGFAIGTLGMGRLADRVGIVPPLLLAGAALGIGYAGAALAPNLALFAAAHALTGFGAGTAFAPLMADTSHWFVKRRGLAVTMVAAGNYLAGAVWPPLMALAMPEIGWRGTYLAIGLVTAALVVPLALLFRPKPAAHVLAAAERATVAARADLGLSPRALQILLAAAGFGCCVAMSVPQVHIVAYCGDLGYGVARGAEMLSLMLGLGIVSRIGSGLLADRIGGTATLFIGSLMQAVALALYMFHDGLVALYVISAVFGLFQGGIVPMYAVIVREFLPPREAGARAGLVISATIVGMAAGGYVSGLIFDLTGSYRLAFLHGLLWNAVNLAVVVFILWRRSEARPLPAGA